MSTVRPRTPPSYRAKSAAHRPPRTVPPGEYDEGSHRSRHSRGPPSEVTVESLSTIPNDVDVDTQEDVQEVYLELQEINEKLKREFKILHQRDLVLKQKEQSLTDLQMSLETAIDNEAKRRLVTKEKEFRKEYGDLELKLKEKNRENRRLKENFDALKNANDILRKELDTLTQSHEKLEKQHHSVQARLINLQRKKEYEEKKEDFSDVLSTAVTAKVKQGIILTREQKSTVRKNKGYSMTCDVMASLLDWVCEVQLRPSVSELPTKLPGSATAQEQMEDRCFKVLPSLVEILREQTSGGSRMVLPCLQFIYWALVHLENSQSQHQKTSLSSTLRRLGEDLYRGRSAKVVDKDTGDSSCPVTPSGESTDKQKEKIFFKSGHLHTRFLSGLVILKTVSQVDYLALVYETIRNDLKTDSGKEFFLYYQATPIMLHHLKPTNKALTSSALDVYLQMSMDSSYLRSFLDTCSQEKWFQAISLTWRMPSLDAKQLEKMSIILQKLSKIKSNKKYFEVFGLTTSCQEVQRTMATQSAFLSLNLKSILYNLNVTKIQPKSS